MSGFDELYATLSSLRDQLILAGGFAVNHHGYTRNTLDMDFVCRESDAKTIRSTLAQAGYSNIEASSVAIQCQNPETSFRVDLLLVDDATYDSMKASAIQCDLSETLQLPTLSLDHLLAMKVHALVQQPAQRRSKDLPDIAWLSILNDLSPDTNLKPICDRYGTDELWHEITDTIDQLRS